MTVRWTVRAAAGVARRRLAQLLLRLKGDTVIDTWVPAGGGTFLFRQESTQRDDSGGGGGRDVKHLHSAFPPRPPFGASIGCAYRKLVRNFSTASSIERCRGGVSPPGHFALCEMTSPQGGDNLPPLCKGRWHFHKKMTEGLTRYRAIPQSFCKAKCQPPLHKGAFGVRRLVVRTENRCGFGRSIFPAPAEKNI